MPNSPHTIIPILHIISMHKQYAGLLDFPIIERICFHQAKCSSNRPTKQTDTIKKKHTHDPNQIQNSSWHLQFSVWSYNSRIINHNCVQMSSMYCKPFIAAVASANADWQFNAKTIKFVADKYLKLMHSQHYTTTTTTKK